MPLPLHCRKNGYDTYGTGKLLHEGAGGDFYTAYGIGPDYGPWPWQGRGRPMNTPHPAQFGPWREHLPVNMHRDLNYGPLSNVPEWRAETNKQLRTELLGVLRATRVPDDFKPAHISVD